MSKESILRRFKYQWEDFYEPFIEGGLKPGTNGESQGRCPFHEDHKPSLSVSQESGLFHCFGCGAEGDIFDFWGRLNNLSTKDNFPKILEGIAEYFHLGNGSMLREKSKIETCYDYTNVDGKLIYQTVRFEPKDFRQRKPDGSGWTWNLKDVQPILYNLPQVLQAEEVIICEGEKDVEALRALGLVATTNSGGAGKWRPEYSDMLKGKHVILIPDNDPPGKRHMNTVAAALNGIAASIKMLELPLAEKKDVFDFIARQPDNEAAAERIAIMIENADPWTPPPEAENETVDSDEILSFKLTDLGNARRLIKSHGQDIKYCYPWKRWHVWNGSRWVEDNTGEIWRRARETAKMIYNEAANEPDSDKIQKIGKWANTSHSEPRLRAMINLAGMNVPVLPADFDRDPFLLNILSGTLNLKTGKLQQHQRADLMSKLAPVKYEPGAECPRWIEFLDTVMDGNQSLIGFLKRAIGYSMTGDTSEQLFFILYGTGANGKTTFLETIKALLGDYSQQANFETFLTKWNDGGATNDLAELQGARFVAASEAGAGRALNEPLLKHITGGEPIRARRLYAENFEFHPQLKLFLAANHRPRIKNQDLGIWRRVRLIPFSIVIPPEEQDHQLLDQLKSELPGILNWCLQGCYKWLESGLDEPVEVKIATSQYREEMDTLGTFLDDRCILSPTSEVSIGDLKKEYLAWCEKNGERSLNRNEFARQLESRGCLQGRSKSGKERIWVGIKLNF